MHFLGMKYYAGCVQKADTNKTPNKNNEDSLDPEEFVKFYKMMTKREEIDDLFAKYVTPAHTPPPTNID